MILYKKRNFLNYVLRKFLCFYLFSGKAFCFFNILFITLILLINFSFQLKLTSIYSSLLCNVFFKLLFFSSIFCLVLTVFLFDCLLNLFEYFLLDILFPVFLYNCFFLFKASILSLIDNSLKFGYNPSKVS